MLSTPDTPSIVLCLNKQQHHQLKMHIFRLISSPKHQSLKNPVVQGDATGKATWGNSSSRGVIPLGILLGGIELVLHHQAQCLQFLSFPQFSHIPQHTGHTPSDKPNRLHIMHRYCVSSQQKNILLFQTIPTNSHPILMNHLTPALSKYIQIEKIIFLSINCSSNYQRWFYEHDTTNTWLVSLWDVGKFACVEMPFCQNRKIIWQITHDYLRLVQAPFKTIQSLFVLYSHYLR